MVADTRAEVKVRRNEQDYNFEAVVSNVVRGLFVIVGALLGVVVTLSLVRDVLDSMNGRAQRTGSVPR